VPSHGRRCRGAEGDDPRKRFQKILDATHLSDRVKLSFFEKNNDGTLTSKYNISSEHLNESERKLVSAKLFLYIPQLWALPITSIIGIENWPPCPERVTATNGLVEFSEPRQCPVFASGS
jgi:hypothetical protein